MVARAPRGTLKVPPPLLPSDNLCSGDLVSLSGARNTMALCAALTLLVILFMYISMELCGIIHDCARGLKYGEGSPFLSAPPPLPGFDLVSCPSVYGMSHGKVRNFLQVVRDMTITGHSE